MSATSKKWPDFERSGPGTLAGRYLRGFWHPVFASAQLPTGRARPLRIMGQDYTLLRTASGRAQVMADRCLHRGTLLSTGAVEGEELRCFYHGWKYDPTGRCTERPAERTSPESLRLRTYPTHETVGLIFAYLGEGKAPPFPPLDPLQGDGVLFVEALPRPFNYFRQIENALDEVHFNFVHRVSPFAAQGMIAELPELSCEDTEFGLSRISKRGDIERQTFFLMPNSNTSLFFGARRQVWRVPVEDTSHISFTVDYFEGTADEKAKWLAGRQETAALIAAAPPAAEVAAAIVRGELPMEAAIDHPDLLSVQDGVALLAQGAYADRENETLGLSDVHMVKMRRLWARDLADLEAGREPRKWPWPAKLEVTSGLPETKKALAPAK
jgi:5,5'-dehydrodivanillate O-demethylase